ncbi:MAG: hypothetical protein EAZ06_02230 [Cytophagales bacterium]|nr:MAG: hypothetical protein EAZ06_02230 [Cytophagales bacterium]
MKVKYFDTIIINFCVICIFVFYYFTQPIITYKNCPLCDGNDYLVMYDYFKNNTTQFLPDFPFHNRLFVPFLASLIPSKSPIFSFQIINFIFIILSVNSIYFFWKYLKINTLLSIIGLFWLCFHWTGIIRLNQMDCLTVDVPSYFFHILLIYFVIEKKYFPLLLITPFATLQKESFLALLIIVLIFNFLYAYKIDKKINYNYILLAFLISLIVKMVANQYFPPQNSLGKNPIVTLFFHLFEAFDNPMLIIRWLISIFMGFGCFILLAFQNTSFQKNNQNHYSGNLLLALSVGSMALGLVAGNDSTRIIFLGFPFIMTWIFLQINHEKKEIILLTLLFSLPLMRLLSVIPDATKNWQLFAIWYPEYAELSIVNAWGIYMFICFGVIFWVKKKYDWLSSEV